MNETARSLRKTWERGFYRLRANTWVCARQLLWKNVLEDLTNKKFIPSCRSLSSEGNGEHLLSMVIPEGTPV